MAVLSGLLKSRTSLLGFALYWAWVTVVFYSDALTLGTSGSGETVEAVWLWTTWAHMITLLFHVCVTRRVPSLLGLKALRIIAPLGISLGVALIPFCFFFLDFSSLPFTMLIHAGSVMAGISSAWLLLAWGERYAQGDISEITLLSILSFAVGLVAYFVLLAFPPIIATVMAILLPLFSGVALAMSEHFEEAESNFGHAPAPKETPNNKQGFSIGLLIALAAIFVFALCGEMLRTFSVTLSDVSITVTGALYLLGGVLGLAVLSGYFLAPPQKNKRITLPLIRNILIIMAVAFLAIPFLQGATFPLAYGIFGAGFWCLRAISWIVAILVAKNFTINPITAVGSLDAFFSLSVVVSAQLNAHLAQGIQAGGIEIATVSLVMVFVLMFMALFVLSRPEISAVLQQNVMPETAAEAEPSADKVISEQVQKLAGRYQLSPRETEVAHLLAKGRSLPYIQEELHISLGTAQTHARHIYKKLGIHSRQEFLNLVELMGQEPS